MIAQGVGGKMFCIGNWFGHNTGWQDYRL